MIFTESMLDDYSQPLGATEDQQCKNAIRMVSDALKRLGFTDDDKEIAPLYPDTYAYSLHLRSASENRKIKIFVQGSYANNTNVRTESDVDVAIIQEDVFTTEYRKKNMPQSDADYGFSIASPTTKSFKDEVQECLEAQFGDDVERRNKSIKVHGNTYRKDTDTVPCRRYRDYRADYSKDANNYIGGIVITPDYGARIINYPEQHIANGRQKNTATHGYYKKFVRIMKKMRYLMEDSRVSSYISAAQNVNSFMLESLLWNIPDTWYLALCREHQKVIVFYQMIKWMKDKKGELRYFKEANGIKPLCANEEDYDHICTFIDQLSAFYQYE